MTQMVGTSSSPSSLKEYLKKYTSNDDEQKKKMKKNRKVKPDVAGVLVVDEDPIWQKPVKLKEHEEENSADEEKPQLPKQLKLRGTSPAGRTDLSPPRRQRGDKSAPFIEPRTLSSHPKVKNDGSSSIASSRKSSHLDDHDNGDRVPSMVDLSPPRKRRNGNESPLLGHRPKTGLVSGKDVKDEIDKMKKEEWLRCYKKHLEPILPDLGDNENMRESGFVIPQEIQSHSWIKRGLPAAQNRHGIKPGRHWDGVDRSTGYEKGLFKKKNEKGATEKEAYLWSVSDM